MGFDNRREVGFEVGFSEPFVDHFVSFVKYYVLLVYFV